MEFLPRWTCFGAALGHRHGEGQSRLSLAPLYLAALVSEQMRKPGGSSAEGQLPRRRPTPPPTPSVCYPHVFRAGCSRIWSKNGGCRNHCQPSPRWMAGGRRLPTPSAQIPTEHLCLSAGGWGGVPAEDRPQQNLLPQFNSSQAGDTHGL